MIEHLWIILPDGSFTVYKNYGKNQNTPSNSNDQEILGFIMAITSISKRMNAGSVEVIKTRERSIHYLNFPSHIIAAVTSNENEEKEVRQVLKEVNNLLIESNSKDTDFTRVDDSNWFLLGIKLDEFFGHS